MLGGYVAPMNIRPATMEDAQRLFDWRNDPLTRAMSKNTDAVEWGGHVAWLQRRLARPDPMLFIAEDAEPVGTFRVDGDEISYTVAPDARGRGVARLMLTEAAAMFGALRAEIKTENIASIRAAEASGFHVHLID